MERYQKLSNSGIQVILNIQAKVLAASSNETTVDDVYDAVWMLDIAEFSSSIVDLDVDDLDIGFEAEWETSSMEVGDYEDEDFKTWMESQGEIVFWSGTLLFTVEFATTLPDSVSSIEFLNDLNLEWYPFASDNENILVLDSQSKILSEEIT